MRAEVDFIFFRCDEAICATLIAKVQQIANIPLGVRVVIGEECVGSGLNSCGSHLLDEALWPCNAAEYQRTRRYLPRLKAATYLPNQFSHELK